MSNIISLPRSSRKPFKQFRRRPASPLTRKRVNRQAGASMAVGSVAVTLTALSLSHLSDGIRIVTHCQEWEGWSMAVGIDAGFISLELAMILAATDCVRRAIGSYANSAIVGTLLASAVMNAFAFSTGVEGLMLSASITLGLAIPAMIYCLTKVAARLWLACDR